jgi:hypothetical protein
MLCEILRLKSGNRSGNSNTIGRLWIRSVKVVFRQIPNQPVSAKDQRQGFDYSRLSAVIWAYKDRVVI